MSAIRFRLAFLGALVAVAVVLRAQTPSPAAPPPQTQGGFAGGGLGSGRSDNADADFSPKDPVLPRTPAEEARSFVLPPGYRMELVLAEPDVNTPAVIEFDGNGRMYVAEFVTYMRDVDGTGEHDPINRITRWESTKGDGRYDKRTVFVDHLILPRMVLPLQNGVILTNETDSDDVVKWTDVDGDGVADRKERFFTGVGLGRDGNLEHEQSGFIWALDNWIYSTYNAFRFRWTPAGMLREPTAPNFGQWGLSMDDDGKPWFADAGGERGPMNFQVPIQYGSFNFAEGVEPGFENVWPIAGVGDVEGGMRRVRMPLGVLNHFTATSGQAIVRGHRLPADTIGGLLLCEPVGRLIRRATVVKSQGVTQLRNAYPGSEFILSTDLFFRPVNIRTAPDGTMFVVDMYHGIIQESQWTPAKSYLRQKIQQYQLAPVIDRGRIWRLRFDGTSEIPALPGGPGSGSPAHPAVPPIEPDRTSPRMYSETPAQLVSHLSHPNGWWRDTAQRLLVLAQDQSVVPALKAIVNRQSPAGAATDSVTAREGALLGRFHALWTIEGLGALDASLVREAMRDASPRMRVQAIRASETLFKAGDKSLLDDYRSLAKDPDADVAIQAMLTLNLFKAPDVADVIRSTQAANPARGISLIGSRLLAAPGFVPGTVTASGRGTGPALTMEQQDLLQRGGAIFNEICFTCHGEDGRGTPSAGAAPGVTLGPPLAGSPRVAGHRDYVVKVLLNGLVGPVGDRAFTEVMVPMGANRDEWIAAVASYVRNSFGNSSGFVTAADVARVRAATASRKSPWTVAELQATLPRMLDVQPNWTASASHNNSAAGRAFTLAGWTSAAAQQSGMWFQVELPAPRRVAEVQFDSASTGRRGGAGAVGAAPSPGSPASPGADAGRGRSAAGAAPAGPPEANIPVGQEPPTIGSRGQPPAAGAGRARGGPGVAPQTAPEAAGAASARGAGRGPGAPSTPGQPDPAAAAIAALGFPRSYRVQVSMDGVKWSAPVAEGNGANARTVIAFTPVQAKFIRITATERAAALPPWSIMNLRLMEAGQ
jgi:mono/diheme cytochrome c family protein